MKTLILQWYFIWADSFTSICMKRYDGRTKPIPKPRPAKKKGVRNTKYCPSNKIKDSMFSVHIVIWNWQTIQLKINWRLSSWIQRSPQPPLHIRNPQSTCALSGETWNFNWFRNDYMETCCHSNDCCHSMSMAMSFIAVIQGSFQEGKDIHSDPFQGGKIWENWRTIPSL